MRWESAVEAGSTVSPHYDPMIAKLIVSGADRTVALAALRRSLDQLIIDGVPSTASFHRWLVDQAPVIEGRVTTRFLDEHALPNIAPELDPAHLAALAWIAAGRSVTDGDPWTALPRFRTTPHTSPTAIGLASKNGSIIEVELSFDELEAVRLVDGRLVWVDGEGVRRSTVAVVGPAGSDRSHRRVAVNLAGGTHGYAVVSRSARWSADLGSGHVVEGALVAPFPGAIAEVMVGVGDVVEEGQTLVVLEAMKMLHPLAASGRGTVAEVRTTVGDQVESHAVLITFESPPSPETD